MEFFNNLQDYFSTLSNQQMLFFWLVAGLLFVIGLLIGLLIRGNGLKRYKSQYLIADKERADLKARYDRANEKEKALQKEVAALSQEKVAALERLEALKKTKTVTNNDSEKVSELQDQLQLLQSENQRLLKQIESNNDSQSSNVGGVAPSNETSGQTAFAGESAGDLQDYLDAAEARFQAFEQRLGELSAENQRLQTQLSNTTDAGSNDRSIDTPYGVAHQPIIGAPTPVDETDGEPLVIRADITEAGVRTDDTGEMEVIVDTTPSLVVPVLPPEGVVADDLKKIKNIGPFLEKQLNKKGIYTYQQIATWSTADINRITKEISYLPGVIAKDDWVGQAKALQLNASTTASQPEKPTTPKKTTAKKKNSKTKTDNLQLIEGIGPKIESILKEAGITTYADVASKSENQLRDILAKAGNRFKSHNPSTWPEQAALARDGKMEALKTLQDKL